MEPKMPNFTPAEWAAHYRASTIPGLVARTLSLRIAVRHDSGVDSDMRFAALEAEQDRRHQRVLIDAHGVDAHELALAIHVEREAAISGMLREFALSALVDMRYHAYETLADVDSYGAACIWIGRLEFELTHRGFILDAETAFNVAHFELGMRQAREEASV
jgi:hypothetical protein